MMDEVYCIPLSITLDGDWLSYEDIFRDIGDVVEGLRIWRAAGSFMLIRLGGENVKFERSLIDKTEGINRFPTVVTVTLPEVWLMTLLLFVLLITSIMHEILVLEDMLTNLSTSIIIKPEPTGIPDYKIAVIVYGTEVSKVWLSPGIRTEST